MTTAQSKLQRISINGKRKSEKIFARNGNEDTTSITKMTAQNSKWGTFKFIPKMEDMRTAGIVTEDSVDIMVS